MKLVPMLSGIAIAVALSACAGKSAQVPVPAADPNGINTLSQQSIQQPNVSGTIWIKQKVALPPDAVLTVTLSDASLADAPSKVLAQKAVRTEGKQSPFSFVLPFNPADVQPNARILLSAAITVNDKLVFIFTEIKLTDNAVQLILSLISFSYGTADLKNKIVFEMLYCKREGIELWLDSSKKCSVRSFLKADKLHQMYSFSVHFLVDFR